MFGVDYKLTNGMTVHFEFPTEAERKIFMAGVESAINWPRRTHQGVTTSETKPVVPVALPKPAPVVKEAEAKDVS